MAYKVTITEVNYNKQDRTILITGITPLPDLELFFLRDEQQEEPKGQELVFKFEIDDEDHMKYLELVADGNYERMKKANLIDRNKFYSFPQRIYLLLDRTTYINEKFESKILPVQKQKK